MRVVFLEDVAGVAQGGDVKEVKNGFARNYLLPKNLAVPATHNALQRVVRLGVEADKTRLKVLSDMRELSELLNGQQVNVEMRAGVSGQLYGSVTNAIVAEKLSELTDREIDRRTVEIEEPIRQLGTFDINVRLHSEVQAQIKVLVYPIGTDPNAVEEEESEAEAEEATEGAESDTTPEAPKAEAEDTSDTDAAETEVESEDSSEADATEAEGNEEEEPDEAEKES